MKLSIINLLRCPNCIEIDEEGRYEIVGDYSSEKIFDGHITCKNGHSWQVRDEVLRFHRESKPEVLYDSLEVDESKVNFLPEGVSPENKVLLLEGFQKFISDLEEDAYAVTGNLVLFVESLGKTDKLFILFSENENELRLAQEITAKNGVYDNFFFIRHDGFVLSPLTKIKRISLFSNHPCDLSLSISSSNDGDVLKQIGEKYLIRQ